MTSPYLIVTGLQRNLFLFMVIIVAVAGLRFFFGRTFSGLTHVIAIILCATSAITIICRIWTHHATNTQTEGTVVDTRPDDFTITGLPSTGASYRPKVISMFPVVSYADKNGTVRQFTSETSLRTINLTIDSPTMHNPRTLYGDYPTPEKAKAGMIGKTLPVYYDDARPETAHEDVSVWQESVFLGAVIMLSLSALLLLLL